MKTNITYEKITNTIIDLLEKGVCPWRKPWSASNQKPCNFASKRAYSGVNFFLLSMMQENPYWLTFNQIKKLDGKLTKGSKGVPVVFWNFAKVKQDDGTEKEIPFLKYYTVFSIADTDLKYELPEIKEYFHDPVGKACHIISRFKNAPKVEEKLGNKACYNPRTDMVKIPSNTQFENSHEFYATFFHELAHSTGHKSRLDRDLTGTFGSKKYALEELTAEMTSAFLCAESGIDNDIISNSASYLQHWIKVLREDNKIVVSAAGKAQKAANLILNRIVEQVEEKAA